MQVPVHFLINTHLNYHDNWLDILSEPRHSIFNGTPLSIFKLVLHNDIVTIAGLIDRRGMEDTSIASELQIWPPDVIMRITPFKVFCAWPSWAEEVGYPVNNTVISPIQSNQLTSSYEFEKQPVQN